MTKIKLSLPSGSEIEKTVISYFNNGGNYLVLDAESVGSMGLPIILVSKVTDKAEKIVDQTEWQQVKGYLKGIISGGQTNYLSIPASLPSDEVYYTQLTLPVASFDALKNNYVAPATAPVAENSAAAVVAPAPAVGDVTNVEESQPLVNPDAGLVDQGVSATQPVDSATTSDIPLPDVEPVSTPTGAAPSDIPPVNMSTEAPATDSIVDTPNPPVEEAVPVVGAETITEEPLVNEGLTATTDNAPVIDTPELPVIEEPLADTNANLSSQEESATPVIDSPVVADPVVESPVNNEEQPVDGVTQNGDLSEIKQRFMKACEDLFDSLSSLK